MIEMKQRENESDYYTVPELAAKLGVSKVTMFAWLRESSIPVLVAKKRWRIPKQAFEKWKQEHSVNV